MTINVQTPFIAYPSDQVSPKQPPPELDFENLCVYQQAGRLARNPRQDSLLVHILNCSVMDDDYYQSTKSAKYEDLGKSTRRELDDLEARRIISIERLPEGMFTITPLIQTWETLPAVTQ